MQRRTVVESSVGRSSRLAGKLLGNALLIAALFGGVGCQGPTRGTFLSRALQPSRQVHGTVCGWDGQPLAGAVVSAYEAKPAHLFAVATPRLIGRQTTGADGAFAFRVRQDVPQVHFVARKPGQGFGWARWNFAQPNQPILVSMDRPAEIAGRVVDDQRKAVPGATVWISLGRGYEDYVNLGKAVSWLATHTDDQGRFRFQDLPAEQVVHFEVAAPGHGQLHTVRLQEEGYPTGQANIDLELPQACTVDMVAVSKETGKPLSNVPLILWSRGLAGETVGAPVPGKPGHIRWTDLPPGMAMVFTATPFDEPPPYAGTRQNAEAKPGEVAEYRVEVSRGQIVEVGLRDAKTGRPVAGGIAGMHSQELKCDAIGRTDRNGIAKLRVIPGEYPRIWARGPLYRHRRRSEPITVAAGEPLRVEVKLEKCPSYRGVVLDVDGKPAAGVSVAVLGEWAHTTSDGDGHFELFPPFYETDQTPTVTLVARQERSNLMATVEVPSPDKAVEIRLQPGIAREVSVVDPDGKPIAGATVTVTLNPCDTRPEGGRFRAYTDATGACTISALSADRPLAMYVQAGGYVAIAKFLPAGEQTHAADRVQLQRVERLTAGPTVKAIPVPVTEYEDAIWGATGRDSRGHIWFAVSKANRPGAGADLFELVPETDEVIHRGNVLEELKRAGLDKPDQQQMKIHSKIYEVDGDLYYVSMDEKGEDERTLAQPVFGSHLWRLRLSDNAWEHLLTIPEAMVGIAVGGGKVYCLGYWHHTLWQYDIATGESRSIQVGSCFGHVSRNLVADARGHVYVPHCAQTAGLLQAALVEYDTDLREVGRSQLPLYYNGTANWSYGITALQPLADGGIALLTHNGWLTIIRPQQNGPARVEQVGWFHPNGPQMSDCLFLDKTGRYLMGAAQNASRLSDWVTYDLLTGRRTTAPLSDGDPAQPSWGRRMVFGSLTRDDQGRCYVVGQVPKVDGEGMRPLLLQISPNAAPTGESARDKNSQG